MDEDLDRVWGNYVDELTPEQQAEVVERFGPDVTGQTVTIDMADVAFMVVVNRDGQSMMRVKCSPLVVVEGLRILADGIELDELSGQLDYDKKDD